MDPAIKREYDLARTRLKDQLNLLTSIQQVLDKSIATGSRALEAVARERLSRQTVLIASTRSLISEIEAMQAAEQPSPQVDVEEVAGKPVQPTPSVDKSKRSR